MASVNGMMKILRTRTAGSTSRPELAVLDNVTS
eukprot:CAMPEP_0194225896 /NCGR_PEP_ID=MMETSP0156-20130528/40618_1 /TAXON_ID=33649 /ORGANISM="Thalassionema nitzschioides, Strain L26-B" /LENGTH=32 /DNA_ID= /DNA_START= /DNA_END= /DNA_ORIENTATION=